MKRLLFVFLLAACTPVPTPQEPCVPKTFAFDAGTRWSHMEFIADATARENTVVIQTGRRSRIEFLDAGPFEFDLTDTCGSVARWRGTAVEFPLILPQQPRRAATTRPGTNPKFSYELTSLIDDPLSVSVLPLGMGFATYTNPPLQPHATQPYYVEFAPTGLGLYRSQLQLQVGDLTTTLDVEGLAGGPIVVAPYFLDAGVVAGGFARVDVRTFTVRNDAPATEDESSDLLFPGDVQFGFCNAPFTLSPLPARIARGQSAQLQLFFAPGQYGAHTCSIQIPTNVAPIDLRVDWSVVTLPPCDVQTNAPVALDGGTALLELTATSNCLLTHPRFEPADAGRLELDWSERELTAGSTLTIPVIANDDGAVVINANSNPDGVLRFDVTN
ncbi:MAG: hypothetical protein ACO1OB_32985 [Archangium sp.]